jgi:hypothetical protein
VGARGQRVTGLAAVPGQAGAGRQPEPVAGVVPQPQVLGAGADRRLPAGEAEDGGVVAEQRPAGDAVQGGRDGGLAGAGRAAEQQRAAWAEHRGGVQDVGALAGQRPRQHGGDDEVGVVRPRLGRAEMPGEGPAVRLDRAGGGALDADGVAAVGPPPDLEQTAAAPPQREPAAGRRVAGTAQPEAEGGLAVRGGHAAVVEPVERDVAVQPDPAEAVPEPLVLAGDRAGHDTVTWSSQVAAENSGQNDTIASCRPVGGSPAR